MTAPDLAPPRPQQRRPTVLFVDDEESILDSLRASLHRLRKHYGLVFANGAEEAKEVFDHQEVDVLVTDIRMPGTSGVQLLDWVRIEHAETVRYVLSGEAERTQMVQAMPVTHQWLAKPCDRDEIERALEQAVQHRLLLDDPAIQTMLAGIDRLPTAPMMYAALIELVSDPDTTLDAVADLVASDAAVAARVLQWANSALASAKPIEDIHQAVVRVGLDVITHLALCAQMVDALLPSQAIPGVPTEALGVLIESTATAAAALAPTRERIPARTAGTLAYTGLLLEAANLPDRLAASYQWAEATGQTLVEAEEELYGTSYPRIGAHLLAMWGLPSALVLNVARSHQLPPVEGELGNAAAAVQAGRLVALAGPVSESLGPPHLHALSDEAEAAVAGWAAVVDEVALGR